MPNKHKNKAIGFNPDDGTLKPWYEARAAGLGVTAKSLYEKALTEHRRRAESNEEESCASPSGGPV